MCRSAGTQQGKSATDHGGAGHGYAAAKSRNWDGWTLQHDFGSHAGAYSILVSSSAKAWF
jgi:hypothetical protein